MSAVMSSSAGPVLPRPQYVVIGATAAILAAGIIYLASAVDGRQAALFVVGAGLGLALHHALFGFTGAYRRFVVDARGRGLRAQLLMVAVASIIFAPLLAYGVSGSSGALAPLGVSVMVGAFLFGIGMQLGGGCASGTLFTVGGGSTRMLITLAAFIAGATLGTAHLPWWLAQPQVPAISLYDSLGWGGGLALQLAVLGALVYATMAFERGRHGALEPAPRVAGWDDGLTRLLRGGWPLVWGAVALALLNVATLLIAGHPWSITWGFSLWGAKIASGLGFGIESWAFWQWPGPARALGAPLADDTVSVMNIGLILGACVAAGLAGRFAPRASLPVRSVLAAVIGGLLLGYGARLAFGCNIGAFFSGAASGSLHGWLWLGFALLGTLVGVRLRPLFGLAVDDARPAAAGGR